MRYPRPVPDPWIDDEPTLREVTARVLSHARHRWPRVVAAAVIATTLLVGYRAVKKPIYVATLVFELQEGDLAQTNDPAHVPLDIRQHIAAVALSRDQLQKLMRKHGVSIAWLDRDPVSAVEEFRERIEVEVTRNYFLFDRRRNDEARSARVSVSLLGGDPDTTVALLREMGDAIVADQLTERAERLRQARDHFSAELARARARTDALRQSIERLSVDLPGAAEDGAIAVAARLAALQAEARVSIDQTVAIEQRAADLAFGADAEARRLGVSLALLDEDVTVLARRLTLAQLAKLALVVLSGALLVAAVVIGAYDDRLYAPADVAASELAVFGALPAFPGDDAFSFRTRASPPARP